MIIPIYKTYAVTFGPANLETIANLVSKFINQQNKAHFDTFLVARIDYIPRSDLAGGEFEAILYYQLLEEASLIGK